MAENGKEIKEGEAKDSLLNGQSVKAMETHLTNTIVQNSFQEARNINVFKKSDEIEKKNEEIRHTNETKFDKRSNHYKIEKKIVEKEQINENVKEVERNIFQMRLKVLEMELKVIKTFSNKELIENDNDIWNRIEYIETNLNNVSSALDISIFKKPENDLLTAEKFSTELMKKLKEVIKKKVIKEKAVINPVNSKEVPDYRSIVTIRGTKEDVANCILKAKTALENCKYDRAENLLQKAERIFPTKNARDLLKQVQAAKEPKQKIEPIEKATKAVNQVNTAKNDKSITEEDHLNASKSLTAFETAFTAGNLQKAERMLNKAKRFDPSLNLEEKLTRVKIAMSNKIKFKKQKEIELQIESQRNKLVEKEKLNMRKSFEDQKGSIEKSTENEKDNFNEKCDNLTTKGIAEDNLTKNERCVTKAMQNYPNNGVKKPLKPIQFVRASQPLCDQATTSKTVKSDDDLEREKVAELFKNLAFDAMRRYNFRIARQYLEWVLKTLPNEETRELLEDVKTQIAIRNGRHSLSKSDIKFVAYRLCSKAVKYIRIDDLEKAEFFLNISQDTYTSQHTLFIIRNFYKYDLHFLGEKKKTDREIEKKRNYRNSKNLIESDRLVEVHKKENNKFVEVENSLPLSSKFSASSELHHIDKLLLENKEPKDMGIGYYWKKVKEIAVDIVMDIFNSFLDTYEL